VPGTDSCSAAKQSLFKHLVGAGSRLDRTQLGLSQSGSGPVDEHTYRPRRGNQLKVPTVRRLRPLARVEQVASVDQFTELTLTGRSSTKGSTCMAAKSAHPGHDNHVIMECGSHEGPGTRYAKRTCGNRGVSTRRE
jgi:hypothetical protein